MTIHPLALAFVQGAVGFVIGAGTNDLAIKWIFRTVFTKKKQAIAESVRDVISRELMTPDRIANRLTAPDSAAALKKAFEQHLAEVCARDLPSPEVIPPMFRSWFRTVGLEVRRIVANRFVAECEAFAREHTADILNETKFWDVVYDAVMSYDDRKMEFVTRKVANRELRGVTLMGGLIGFIVGFAESLLIWLLGWL